MNRQVDPPVSPTGMRTELNALSIIPRSNCLQSRERHAAPLPARSRRRTCHHARNGQRSVQGSQDAQRRTSPTWRPAGRPGRPSHNRQCMRSQRSVGGAQRALRLTTPISAGSFAALAVATTAAGAVGAALAVPVAVLMGAVPVAAPPSTGRCWDVGIVALAQPAPRFAHRMATGVVAGWAAATVAAVVVTGCDTGDAMLFVAAIPVT